MEMEEKGGNKRSGLSPWLFFFLGVFLTASVGLAIALGLTLAKDGDKSTVNEGDSDSTVKDGSDTVSETSAMCMTPSCVLRAGQIMQSMDTTVDPCEDFYQYSCGNWIKSRSLPDGRSIYSTFDEIAAKIKLQLKRVIEQPYNSRKDTVSIRKMKFFYQSCLNEEKQTEIGVEPLKKFVDELGPWPLLTTGSVSPPLDLELMLTKLALVDVAPLVLIKINPDTLNASRYITWIDSPYLSMDREIWLKGLNSTEVLAFEDYQRQLAIHVLGLEDTTSLRTSISETVEFEFNLAKLTDSRTDRRVKQDLLLKNMTISQLKNTIPEIDWFRFLTDFFKAANITVTGDTEIILFAEDYMKGIVNLTKNTDNRIIANYFLMRTITGYAKYVSPQIRQLKAPLNQVLVGISKPLPTWVSCLEDLIYGVMPEAIGQLYIRNYFSSAAKEKVKEMVRYVRASLKEMITDVPWMDKETKSRAIDKLEAVKENIAYPDYQFNETVIGNIFKYVDHQPDTYFQNGLAYYRSLPLLKAQRLLESPGSKTDRWSFSAPVVNAYYDRSANGMVFPAGILQPPFYAEDFLRSQMFGGIGVVIGHEFTHGFDDQGRKYDKDGNKADWWSQSSVEQFKELAKCHADFLEKETIAGLRMDGNLKMGESIADAGGSKAAFLAFHKWQMDNGKQPLLPGLNLTHEQVFFINFAQSFCTLTTTERLQQQVTSGYHPPSGFRMNMLPANSKGFAESFHCPVGSPMNPAKKCTLW